LGADALELGIRAVARLLVGAPAAKLRCVTEAAALHVIVGDFDDQFGTQRLPRQIFALAPPALAARHAPLGFTARLRPIFPRVSGKRVFAVGSEEFYQLAALCFREARAPPDPPQAARAVQH